MCGIICLKIRIWMWNMDNFLISYFYFIVPIALPHYTVSSYELWAFGIKIISANWSQHQTSTNVSKNLGETYIFWTRSKFITDNRPRLCSFVQKVAQDLRNRARLCVLKRGGVHGFFSVKARHVACHSYRSCCSLTGCTESDS